MPGKKIAAVIFGGIAVAAASAASAAPITYNYHSDTAPTYVTFGSDSDSAATFGPVNSGTTVSGTSEIKIASIGDQTTATPSLTDTGSVNFTDTIAIDQTSSPAASGTLTVTGTIVFTRSDTGGETSTLTNFASTPVTIGGDTFTASLPIYAPPTVNSAGGEGALSITLATTGVPEPASLGLIGLAAIATLRRRRNA